MRRLLFFLLGFSLTQAYGFTVYLDSTRYDNVSQVRVDASPPPAPPPTPGQPAPTPPPTPTPPPAQTSCPSVLNLVRKGDPPAKRNHEVWRPGQVHAWSISSPATLSTLSATSPGLIQAGGTTRFGSIMNRFIVNVSDCPGELTQKFPNCRRQVAETISLWIIYDSVGARNEEFFCKLPNKNKPYYINIGQGSCSYGASCGYFLDN